MRTLLATVMFLGLASVAAPAARADVPPPQPLPLPAEQLEGELRVALKNAEYCKVSVNGEEWETIEFEHKGKDLIIKGLKLSQDRNAIILTPNEATLAPLTLDVLSKEFKKQREGKFYVMVARKAVAFEKAAPVDPNKPNEPEKRKVEPLTPPPEKKVDL